MRESDVVKRARQFLGGERLTFDAAFAYSTCSLPKLMP
jgi:hypothetical protein